MGTGLLVSDFEQFLFTAVEPGSAFCQRTGAVIFGL
jgi:hypothetical protein